MSRPDTPDKFGVARGGNVSVTCEVAANPPASRFRWWFSSAGKAVEVKPEDYTSTGKTSTVVYS